MGRAMQSGCKEPARQIADLMKGHLRSFCPPLTKSGLADLTFDGHGIVAPLMHALDASERDLRQHRGRPARQCNCKAPLVPGCTVPAVVLVLQ
jgi:hypothetical protein